MSIRRGHRARVLLAGVLAIAAQLGAGPAVGAATTTTGGGLLAGTLTIPYPCSTCGGSTGNLTASAALSLTGVPASGDFYTATWPDPRTTPPGTVPANFTTPQGVGVSTDCTITAPVPPLLGGGSAGFTLSGGLLVVNGATWDNATLTGQMTWEWVGPTTATVMLTGATLTGGSGPSVVAVSLSLNNMVIGVGAMTFEWNVPMGNCAVQNPNQTALVQAAVEQPA